MTDSEKECTRLFDTQDFRELDYSILNKHIETLTRYAELSCAAITIQDDSKPEAVFKSKGYCNLFGDDDDVIHPDDLEGVIRSGVIALRYFFLNEL